MTIASKSAALTSLAAASGLGRVAVLRGIGLARLRADDLDVAARLAEPEDGIPEFQVLVELLDEDGDALALVCHGCVPHHGSIVQCCKLVSGGRSRPR